MNFQEIASYFDRIESTPGRLDMTGILAELFKKTRPEEIRGLVYLVQGVIAPSFKSMEIGLGEKLVEQAISKITGYTQQKVHKTFLEKGDLGETAQLLLEKKTQQSLFKEKLSLEKVFKNFVKISSSSGTGSQELKLKLLAELLNSANPLEAKYLVRIPLGRLRLGIGDPTIMDSFSVALGGDKTLREKIEEKYNIHSDLGFIAETLWSKGMKGLKEIQITPGIPLRPTLAERLPSSKEIIAKLGECAAEAKYDGFRFQIHKQKDRVWIFSRNSENMTHMFPEIVKAVKKQVKAGSAVMEGEALAVNQETGEYYPFQVTIQRKRKHEVSKKAEEYPLQVFLFELMYLEGESTLSKPFKERRKRLEQIIGKGEILKMTEQIITSDPKELDSFFDLCVQRGLEGIIAKDLNSPYIAGARKYAWIKLKRSYKGELTDTIDVVIIGYFKGKGKRTTLGVGALLTAVYNEEKDLYESIAKVGTGFSEEMLSKLEKMLSPLKEKSKPSRVISELTPDYWVTPHYVIECIADEITLSPTHSAGKEKGREGYALRFPRMTKLRTDKSPDQSTTVNEIKKMFKDQKRVGVENEEGIKP